MRCVSPHLAGAALAALAVLAPPSAAAPNPGTSGATHLDALTNRPPSASVGGEPLWAPAGEAVVFDASASSDPDGEIVRAVWDFGDGSSAEGMHVAHTYSGAGAWLALLTVTDDRGAFASTPVRVEVGPQPAIVSEDVTITVSTGDRIHLRIHRGEGAAPGPVVLRYSIYCVSFDAGDEALVRSGYVFVAAETPGVCGSGGKFDLWGPRVARAGHDVVEWVAARPWADGRVALVGHSGPAITALATALERPPSLRTVVLGSPIVDFYRDVAWPGGTLTAGALGFNALLVAEPRPGMEAERVEGWIEWETDLLGHDTDDGFYRARSLAHRWSELEVPALVLGSWNDIYWRGALELVPNLVHEGSRVVVYPGPHYNMGDPHGTKGYRTTAEQNVHAGSEERVWLDRWLRGAGSGPAGAPLAYYRQTGGGGAAQSFSTGEWEETFSWPLPGLEWRRLHLAGDGRGAGRLDDAAPAPAAEAAPLVLAGAPSGAGNPSWIDFLATSHRQVDGRPMWDVDTRIDDGATLTFETAPLESPLDVIGPITLTFTAMLASTDATFHATVSDVWPDGSAHWITQGTLRASMRAIDDARTLRNGAGEIVRVFHPHDHHEPLTPGEEATYVVEIWPTANRFDTGHRVRLQLSLREPWSVDTPAAAGTLRLDAAKPASLLLPVRP